MRYAYYPGCSLEINAAAYDHSVREVADLLDIKLQETRRLELLRGDGKFSQDELTACAVVARNLALVDPQIKQFVAPCAACYLNLKKTDRLMADFRSWAEDQSVPGGRRPALRSRPGDDPPHARRDPRRHRRAGHARQGDAAVAGLRVAPYYGCQVVRPIKDCDSTEYPMKMDNLLAWLGAEVVDYPVKAHCCGGHMTQISEPQAFELIRRLLQSAQDYHADMILCMCPMCRLNLDGYQAQVNGRFRTPFNLPILYSRRSWASPSGWTRRSLVSARMVAAMPVLKAKLNGKQAASGVREAVSARGGSLQIRDLISKAERLATIVVRLPSTGQCVLFEEQPMARKSEITSVIGATSPAQSRGRRGSLGGQELRGRGRLPRLQVHVHFLRREPDRRGTSRRRASRGSSSPLLAAPAREDLPPGLREHRYQPLPPADDQHPRALLVGPYRQESGPPRRPRPSWPRRPGGCGTSNRWSGCT